MNLNELYGIYFAVNTVPALIMLPFSSTTSGAMIFKYDPFSVSTGTDIVTASSHLRVAFAPFKTKKFG